MGVLWLKEGFEGTRREKEEEKEKLGESVFLPALSASLFYYSRWLFVCKGKCAQGPPSVQKHTRTQNAQFSLYCLILRASSMGHKEESYLKIVLGLVQLTLLFSQLVGVIAKIKT